MARVPVDISNGFYESFSTQLANLVCKNLRPFVPDNEAYSQTALRSTDGISSFIDTTYKISRGGIEILDRAFFVQANQLIELNADGTKTDRGTISGTDRVSMAASQTYVWIVVPDGDTYYFELATNTLTLNTDVNFLGTNATKTVVFKDSFFVFNTDTIVFNADLDGISFSPLDYGTAEVNPDTIKALVVNSGQMYAGGTKSIQVYQTRGGNGFPFSTIPSATIEKGFASTFGVVKAGNTFFFVGGGENEAVAIYRFLGNGAEKISTSAIDHYIQSLSDADIQACFAFSYQADGEEYVVFTFGSRTFIYQIKTSQKKGRHIWHERTSSGTRWRVNTLVKAHNRLYVGDNRTDKIGYINPRVFTEYGDTVPRLFTTQPFNFDGAPAFVGSYEMAMATGVGNDATAQPVVSHRFSSNGINFGSYFTRKMGGKGEFNTRVMWRRMGKIEKQRVLEFSTNEPCETTFYRIEAEVEGGV